jgi:hypothetical protein
MHKIIDLSYARAWQPNEIIAHARNDGSLRFGSVLKVNGDGTLEVWYSPAFTFRSNHTHACVYICTYMTKDRAL